MRKEGEELCLGETELSKKRAFLGVIEIESIAPAILAEQRRHIFQTVFEAFAIGWDSFPRRFSRKAANIELARAGKSRCIRSMR